MFRFKADFANLAKMMIEAFPFDRFKDPKARHAYRGTPDRPHFPRDIAGKKRRRLFKGHRI